MEQQYKIVKFEGRDESFCIQSFDYQDAVDLLNILRGPGHEGEHWAIQPIYNN